MAAPWDSELIRRQRQRLGVYQAQRCVDTHCHCLPGIDDGPSSLEESLALCRALVQQGITHVIATPHQLGRYEGAVSAPVIRSAVETLNESLLTERIPLTILPGAEIRVDERVASLLQEDELMTLADRRRHVLLELPFDLYLDLSPLLAQLQAMDLRAVVAHPERNRVIAKNPERIRSWSEYDPILQITCGSVVGRFGPSVQAASFALMDLGFQALVASDAHDTHGRSPCFAESFAAVNTYFSFSVAQRYCIEAPLHLIGGCPEPLGETTSEEKAQLA